MKCIDCPQKYIGQRPLTFSTRLKQHTGQVRYNNGKSAYPHAYGSITQRERVRQVNTQSTAHTELAETDDVVDVPIDFCKPIFGALQEVNTR
jgi:hypothetical protein